MRIIPHKVSRTRIIFIFLFFSISNFLAGNETLIEKIYTSSEISVDKKYDSINNHFFLQRTPVEQLSNSEFIIDLAQKDGNSTWLYYGYYFKANAYYYFAEPEKACDYYLKSLEVLKHNDFENVSFAVYIGLGNAYSMNGDIQQSIHYFKKALNSMPDSHATYFGYTLLNIVDGFYKIPQYDSADFYLKKADSLFSKLNNNTGTAYVLGHKAILHTHRGAYKLAEQNFFKTDSILQLTGDSYSVLSFQLELARVQLKKGEYQQALKKLSEGNKESIALGYRELSRDFTQLLSEARGKLGDYQQAWLLQKEYIQLNDSICNESNVRKIADLRTEYEVSQKQLEIDLLERHRFTNRIIIVATSIIALALFIFLYLLYKNFKIVSQQQKLLEHQKKELQELVNTKDKMFSIISHDLRGPLHSLSGLTSLMDEIIAYNSKEQLLEINNSMHKSLQAVISLMDNLLEWAMQEQGRTPYAPFWFNPKLVFNELLDIFENMARAKEIQIILNMTECEQVFADKNTFSAIFRNLIGNALKFTEKGGSIRIQCNNREGLQKFTISDTGIGIAQEKLQELFNTKGLETSYGTENEKGIGLGLRLAYEFTKLNKGNIYAESEVGKGTTFYVEIPVENTEAH